MVETNVGTLLGERSRSERPMDYPRLPEEIRLEFKTGELLSTVALTNGIFQQKAGERASEAFGQNDDLDEVIGVLKLTPGYVMGTIERWAGIHTVFEVIDSSIDYLDNNPGLLNGDTEAVRAKLESYRTENGMKNLLYSPGMLAYLESKK